MKYHDTGPPSKHVEMAAGVVNQLLGLSVTSPHKEECISNVIRKLKAGTIQYTCGGGFLDLPHHLIHCQHTILFSINRRAEKLYIIDVYAVA